MSVGVQMARGKAARLYGRSRDRAACCATALFKPLETAMNKDQVKGRAKEVKGKVKEVTGKVTGNKTQEVKGKVEKNLGKAQAGYGDLKSEVKDR
jgi:uncharacterized protein YjbJ (UPF0337 family)